MRTTTVHHRARTNSAANSPMPSWADTIDGSRPIQAFPLRMFEP